MTALQLYPDKWATDSGNGARLLGDFESHFKVTPGDYL
jgi:hypothetical protein